MPELAVYTLEYEAPSTRWRGEAEQLFDRGRSDAPTVGRARCSRPARSAAGLPGAADDLTDGASRRIHAVSADAGSSLIHGRRGIHGTSTGMNRFDKLFGLKGEARVRFADGEYHVLSAGDFVRCAVTGDVIAINELKYWSVERQEAYGSAAASLQRYLELRAKPSKSHGV